MSFVEISANRRFSDEKYQKINLFATERSAMDVYCLLPGQAQKVHSHAGSDKYYCVLEGVAQIRIGEQEREVGAGWTALALPGVEHGIRNAGAGPLVVLVFHAPKTF